MKLELQQLTTEVRRIATEVGNSPRKERQNFSRESVVEKYMHDYVSYVDRESKRLLVEQLPILLPEAGFIAEEGSDVYKDRAYCWVIDPLGGTTNHIHDNAPYCASIVLQSRAELLLDIVYEVCRDERFCVWRGGKAWTNGDELHIPRIGSVEETFIITEPPYNHRQCKRTAEYLLEQLYGMTGGIRMSGSATPALCYVAAGRFDTWAEVFIGKWDYSAVAVIILEAGGKVTDFYGSEYFIKGHHIVATNSPSYPAFQQLLEEVPPLGM